MIKIKFSLLLFLFLCFSCLPSKDPFFFTINFPEPPEESIKECLKENPDANRYSCNIKNYLSSPIILLLLHELLIETTEALDAVGIPYVLESGSAIGAKRFNASLPWDDDHDLAVLEKNASKEKLAKFKKELSKRGFRFDILISNSTIRNSVGYQGLYQVAYGENRFKKLLLTYDPTMNPEDINNSWKHYQNRLSVLPHLDIFLYEEIGGKYAYKAKHFADGQLKGRKLDREILESSEKINVLGKEFFIVDEFDKYGEICYGSNDLVNDFVVNREHSGTNEKIRFKNIKDSPHTLRYLIDYLNHVYNSEATKRVFKDIEFDKKKCSF